MKTQNSHTHWKLAALASLFATMTALAAPEVKEEFHQTYPLAAQGEVQLENINGHVHITTWDQPSVKVDAVKSAKTKEDLDAVKIEIDSKPDRIGIKTRHPDSSDSHTRNNSGSVDYELTVPKQSVLEKIHTVNGNLEIKQAAGKVSASSVNGRVTAEALSGEVDLSTVNGAIKASLADVKNKITLKTVNGSVTLGLPANANADVSAKTVNGAISSDFDLKADKNGRTRHQKLDGKLGSGGPLITLSSVNGAVHLEQVKP
jgi:DUF4097 and DUF4098 domain-containing protein YvlB